MKTEHISEHDCLKENVRMEVRLRVLPSFRRSLSRVVKKNIAKKLCKLTLPRSVELWTSNLLTRLLQRCILWSACMRAVFDMSYAAFSSFSLGTLSLAKRKSANVLIIALPCFKLPLKKNKRACITSTYITFSLYIFLSLYTYFFILHVTDFAEKKGVPTVWLPFWRFPLGNRVQKCVRKLFSSLYFDEAGNGASMNS